MHTKYIGFILFLFIFLNGCAKPTLQEDPYANQVADSWDKYILHSQNVKISPFRISMSLHLNNEDNNYRVNAVFWGNSTHDLRLDVVTSMGGIIAKIAQTKDDFLVYEPSKNRAYFHYGKRKPLLRLKIPIPFGLPELAALLNGQYSDIFGSEYITKNNMGNLTSYTLAKKDIGGNLQLNSAGLPIIWKSTDRAWTMTIKYASIITSKKSDAQATDNLNSQTNLIPMPKNIEIIGPDSKKTVLLVKKNQQLTKPFAENNLKLRLPESVILKPLKTLPN